MLEIVDQTSGDYRTGTRLPYFAPKLVLEATDTQSAESAIKLYGMDPKSHRPHYVLDPEGSTIYKLADTEYSAVGDFHPTAPHRSSRCVFVGIVKSTAVTLSGEATVQLGRLLRVLCDVEAVPAIVHSYAIGEKVGHETLRTMEGVVCLHAFPGGDHTTTPGHIDWDRLEEGLQNYDTPERVGVVNDGEILIFEDEPEAVEEIATGDLDSLKVAELKEIASELGLSYSNLKKAELITAITEARS
jgi:hypothetical protein